MLAKIVYSSLYEKNVGLSSIPATWTCESQDGDRIDTGPGPFASQDTEDQWDRIETAAGEEEDKKEETEDVGERDESQMPLQSAFPLHFLPTRKQR